MKTPKPPKPHYNPLTEEWVNLTPTPEQKAYYASPAFREGMAKYRRWLEDHGMPAPAPKTPPTP